MQFIKKHSVLILAFALPVLVIIGVSLSVYLPSLFLSTKYDFVYATCGDNAGYYGYTCQNYLQKLYSVQNGKLVVNAVDPNMDSDYDRIPDISENYAVRIFLHNTEKNESREISLAEAQGLNLANLLTSPDGVTISSGYSRHGGIMPFDSGYSSYGQYLSKGNSRIKLNLISSRDGYYYNDNFYFLGWVTPGRD